jgi:hypothetical protein
MTEAPRCRDFLLAARARAPEPKASSADLRERSCIRVLCTRSQVAPTHGTYRNRLPQRAW